MSNKIQIRRSVANGVVSSLSNGELAFTQASNTLWIGLPDGSATWAIGGARYPGVLTANQALVANGTGGIDNIISNTATLGNLNVGGSYLWQNTGNSNNFIDVAFGDGIQIAAANAGNGVRITTQYSGAGSQNVPFTWQFDSYDGHFGAPGNLIPTTNNAFNIGNSSYVWANLYITNLNSPSIYTANITFSGDSSVQNTAFSPTYSYTWSNTQSFNGNVTIGTAAGLIANGSVGTAGQILYSNGTTIYWANNESVVGGSNTQIQYNDSGIANGSALFAFNKDTSELYAPNTTFSGDIIPSADNTGQVGEPSYRWSNGYFTNSVLVGDASGNAQAGWTNVESAVIYQTYGQTHNSTINAGNPARNPEMSLEPYQFEMLSGVDSYGDFYAVGYYGTIQTGWQFQLSPVKSRAVITIGDGSAGAPYITFQNSSGSNAPATDNSTSDGTKILLGQSVSDISIGRDGYDIWLKSGGTNQHGQVRLYAGNAQVFVANALGSFTTGLVNATAFTVGTSTIANATGVYTSTVNASSFTIGSNLIANSTQLFFNGANVNFDSTLVVNGAIIPGTNSTFDLGSSGMRWNKLWLAGQTLELGSVSLSENNGALEVNNAIVDINLTVNNIIGTTTNISSNLSITAANVDMASAYLRVRDIYATGNLTVTGTLTTVDTQTTTVTDSFMRLADQNSSSDIIDIGFYAESGNSSATYYSGLYRDHAGSSLTAPLFKIFSSNVLPTSTVDNTAPTYSIGTLEAYLVPYGVGGAFVANSSNVYISANSTVGVNFIANTLTLSTPLAGTSGGTGQNTYTTQDILVANTSNGLDKLSLPMNSDGYVLQVQSGLVAWDYLDGGTF